MSLNGKGVADKTSDLNTEISQNARYKSCGSTTVQILFIKNLFAFELIIRPITFLIWESALGER